MNDKMRRLIKANESLLDQDKVKKQDIVEGLAKAEIDYNDQLAVIFNALSTLTRLMPEGKEKAEFEEYLAKRKEIKEKAKTNSN